MTAFKGLGTYGNAAGVVTPLDHKLAQAGLLCKTTTPLLIRPGVFYAGDASLVAGTAGMAYLVDPYEIVTQRSAGAGVVFGGNDGALSVATTAAPGSNSRYDVVYHWHREFSLDGTDSNPVIGVVQGVAAASPTVPSLAAFPGAIELARILVPAGVTATNSGTTITQTAPFTSTDGGKVPFRTTTEMNLWLTALTKQQALDISSGIVYEWTGSAWATTVPVYCSLRKSANQNLTNVAAALVLDVEISDPRGMHDNVTNNTRIVAVEAGLYEFTTTLFNSNTSGMGTAEARLNGTTAIPGSLDRRTADATAALPLHQVFSIALALNDYVEIMVFHASSAGTIAGGTTQGAAVVTAKRLGPAS